MTNNTQDFSKFGYREIEEASDLLTAYLDKNKTERMEDEGIKIEFNPNSGMVFLVDGDYNVGVLKDDKLVDFLTCSECGYEGTLEDYKSDKKNGNTKKCCKEYFEA